MTSIEFTGPDLDKAIAEKVMGWKWYACQWGNQPRLKYLDDPKKRGGFPDNPEANGDEILAQDAFRYLPSYSMNISHAFDVVAHMEGEGYRWDFMKLGDHVVAAFTCPLGPCERHGNPNHDFHEGSGEAETLPLAICRAALAAKGCG